MKKLCAWALACVLFLGAAAVPATAQKGVPLLSVVGCTESANVLDHSILLADGDGEVNQQAPVYALAGKTLYFELEAAYVAPQDTYSDPGVWGDAKTVVSDLNRYFRVHWNAEEGKKEVESVALVGAKNAQGKKMPYLAVRLRDGFQEENKTVSMAITLSAKSGAALKTGPSFERDNSLLLTLTLESGYGETQEAGAGVCYVKDPLVSFGSEADDVLLCFDSNVEIQGNMRHQTPLFLRVSTKDEDLQDRYPNAQLYLFDGNRKTFRRSVTVRLPAAAVEGANGKPRAPFLYDIQGNTLQEVKAAYNPDEELFSIATNVPGRYVISDEKLSAAPANASSVASSTPSAVASSQASAAASSAPSAAASSQASAALQEVPQSSKAPLQAPPLTAAPLAEPNPPTGAWQEK